MNIPIPLGYLPPSSVRSFAAVRSDAVASTFDFGANASELATSAALRPAPAMPNARVRAAVRSGGAVAEVARPRLVQAGIQEDPHQRVHRGFAAGD